MKLFESIKTFQYRLPTEPEKMLYDFYFLVGYCRGAFSDDKVLSFVIEEAVEDCTKALQKHILKALKWSLTCEARHTVRMTLHGEVTKLKPESKKLLVAFMKELDLLDSSSVQGLLSKVDPERSVDAKVNKAAARSPDVWSGNKYGDFPGRGDSFAVVNVAMKAACKKLKVTDKKLSAFFEDIYSLSWSNSYGGKAWLGIANCYSKLLEAKDVSARIVWIDHAYDLQHNTDTVFNKVPAYYKNGGFSWLARALDWKRDATDPREFYDKVSGSLREVVAYISYHQYGKSILDREGDLPAPKSAPVMTGSDDDIHVGAVLELDLVGNKDQLYKDGVLQKMADNPINFSTVKVVIFNEDDPFGLGVIFITADDLTTADFYHKLRGSYIGDMLHSAEGKAKTYIEANPQLEEVAPFALNCARWIPRALITKIGTNVKDSSTATSSEAPEFKLGAKTILTPEKAGEILAGPPAVIDGFFDWLIELGATAEIQYIKYIKGKGAEEDRIVYAILKIDGEGPGDENYDLASKTFFFNSGVYNPHNFDIGRAGARFLSIDIAAKLFTPEQSSKEKVSSKYSIFETVKPGDIIDLGFEELEKLDLRNPYLTFIKDKKHHIKLYFPEGIKPERHDPDFTLYKVRTLIHSIDGHAAGSRYYDDLVLTALTPDRSRKFGVLRLKADAMKKILELKKGKVSGLQKVRVAWYDKEEDESFMIINESFRKLQGLLDIPNITAVIGYVVPDRTGDSHYFVFVTGIEDAAGYIYRVTRDNAIGKTLLRTGWLHDHDGVAKKYKDDLPEGLNIPVAGRWFLKNLVKAIEEYPAESQSVRERFPKVKAILSSEDQDILYESLKGKTSFRNKPTAVFGYEIHQIGSYKLVLLTDIVYPDKEDPTIFNSFQPSQATTAAIPWFTNSSISVATKNHPSIKELPSLNRVRFFPNSSVTPL
jgi:hypothetical protein